MKRKSLLLALAVLITVFAFVSCSGNVAPEDRLGTISFRDENSRAVTTVIKYSSDVEDLVWFYKATKLDDGYTTGQTSDYKAVAVATSSTGNDNSTTCTPTTGLSGKTLNSAGFSYGLWKIELAGYKYETDKGGTQNVEVSTDGTVTIKADTDPEYVSTINNHLVDKGATYASAKIEVGENATTKIEFGEIKFEVDDDLTNITTSSKLTLSVTDGTNTIYSTSETANGTTTYSIEAPTISVSDSQVTVTSKQLKYLEEGNNIVGDHTMNFVLSQELTNTDSKNTTKNTTIEAALYTLKFTVIKGTTTTISGTILKNDKTGTIQIDSFQDVEPITVSRVLDVEEINDTANTAKVSSEKTITIGTMRVTYPKGALISTDTDSVTVADSTNKTGTADAEQGIVRNDAAETSTISVGTNESRETYQLTLVSDKSATSENSALVVVEFFYGKNREVKTVYHNGTEIVAYSTLSESTDETNNKKNTESYSYDSGSGIMTLRVFHASPITIVSKELVAKVNGTGYYSLTEAISKASSGDTVTLLGNTSVTEKISITSGKSLTIDLSGKKISFNGTNLTTAVENAGTLTLKDGTVEYKNARNMPTDAMSNYSIINNSGTLKTSALAINVNVAAECRVLLKGFNEAVADSDSCPGVFVIENSGTASFDDTDITLTVNKRDASTALIDTTVNEMKFAGVKPIIVYGSGSSITKITNGSVLTAETSVPGGVLGLYILSNSPASAEVSNSTISVSNSNLGWARPVFADGTGSGDNNTIKVTIKNSTVESKDTLTDTMIKAVLGDNPELTTSTNRVYGLRAKRNSIVYFDTTTANKLSISKPKSDSSATIYEYATDVHSNADTIIGRIINTDNEPWRDDNNTGYVCNEAGLQEVMKDQNVNIVLTNDITLTNGIKLTGNLTLDLAGHNITCSTPITIFSTETDVTLTLKNSQKENKNSKITGTNPTGTATETWDYALANFQTSGAILNIGSGVEYEGWNGIYVKDGTLNFSGTIRTRNTGKCAVYVEGAKAKSNVNGNIYGAGGGSEVTNGATMVYGGGYVES